MDTPSTLDALIVVVDDQQANLRLLERILRHAGYHRVICLQDPRRAAEIVTAHRPDLLLLDLHMPELDGFTVLEQIRPRLQGEAFLPVLVLTADNTAETKHLALARGAKDFLTKPFDPTEALLRIRNLLEMRSLHVELSERNRALEDRVRERTRELEETQQEVLERLAQAAELHDDETGLHTRRVGHLSARLGTTLGLPAAAVEWLRRTAPLHDVGKIGVPDALLRKPGGLTPREREVMQRHTVIGARILGGGRSPATRMAEEVALSHHERWDGRGYPRGLRGEDIPLSARIVAVADVFDALAHDRPYRPAVPSARAGGVILEGSGSHFDPAVVEAFAILQAQDARG